MEAAKRTLHPLLTAAAVSVIVFSGVGVAAITGILPTTKGSVKEQPVLAETEAPASESTPAAVPAPKAPVPVHKPAKKRVVDTAPKPRPAPAPAPVTYEPVAQAPQPLETPKPVVKPGLLGTVESVREVEQAGDAKGIGAVGGGIAGAVLGHNIGDHNKLVTVLGAAGGALLGNQIEKQARATKHWEMTLRLDDGTTQTIQSDAQPVWRQGDRVRLLNGELQPV
jgi:outer membrane lipoprotein SlyB